MDRSFRRGFFVGVVGPLAFMAGVAYWIFRATGKVPFPVNQPAEGELVIRLVEPGEVPGYWSPWRDALVRLGGKLLALGEELKARFP